MKISRFVLGLIAACLIAFATPANAQTCHLQVCGDNLQFCLAGCTSTSPSDCRSNCYATYNSCTKCDSDPPASGGEYAKASPRGSRDPLSAPTIESFLRFLMRLTG